MATTSPLVAAGNAAAVCEVIWYGPDGGPDATTAVPLVLDGDIALAFPYARAATARAIGSARRVAVVCSDRRVAADGWTPLAVLGRPRVIADRDGSLFSAELLHQELRKYPPSRALADSFMLRREHWWYLPRLVVALSAEAVTDVAARDGGAGDAVIGVLDADERLRPATVRAAAESATTWRLRPLDDRPSAADTADGRPAVLLRHDFSPDLERWTHWRARGTLIGDTFEVSEQTGDIALPPPLGLLARMRRQRTLARGCRAELAR